MRSPLLFLIACSITSLSASSADRQAVAHRRIDRPFVSYSSLNALERTQDPGERVPPHWWSRQITPPLEAVHALANFFPNEGILELEDGSRWMVTESSWRVLHSLNYGERVTFQQNRSWFSAYPFQIVILRSGEAIEASPVEGPLLNSPYCRSLVGASGDRTTLELSDGTRWEIDLYHSRRSEMGSWAIYDVIMVGTHDSGWWSSNYPALLYNCGADSWIPARRLR
jgi:hypothetical protein